MLGRYIIKSKEKYLFEENEQLKVKFNVFMPHGEDYSLSVYNISSFSEDQLWSVADEFVTAKMVKPDPINGCAHAPFEVVKNNREIKKAKLQFNENGEPHPMHVNIENWTEKADAKLAAMELSRITVVRSRIPRREEA